MLKKNARETGCKNLVWISNIEETSSKFFHSDMEN